MGRPFWPFWRSLPGAALSRILARMNTLKTTLALGLLLASALGAAELPDAVLPAGAGVNIHFTRGHERDLDLIAAAGFKFIRMDLGWGGIERKKGEFNWSDYDALTASLEQRGLRAIYILDYSNPLYEETVVSQDPITQQTQRNTASPQHPESVAAFARWAAAAARHFQGRHVIWEIWNEPNISFWQPKPDVQQYLAMALATCQAVRQADPQATIIAPGSSEFPWEFLEALCHSGLLEQLDAVSVHPYRSYHRGPETLFDDLLRLRALIARHAPAGKRNLPIISSEWGYATQTKGGLSLEAQAAFLARQQLANRLFGVPLSIWYDWKNDGTDPAYNEHNFGTVYPDLKPKPSYLAMQTLGRELKECSIVRRLSVGGPDDYVLLCTNRAGVQKLAAWTTGEPHTVAVSVGLETSTTVTAVDGQGQPLKLTVAGGDLRLQLGAAPQYITFTQPSPVLAEETAWQLTDHFVPVLGVAAAWETIKFPKSSNSFRLTSISKAEQAFPVQLAVRNPWPKPVRFSVTIPGGGKTAQNSVVLQPGAASLVEASYSQYRRDALRTTVPVRVEVAEISTPPKTLRLWEESIPVAVLNPITLSLAPVEGGERLVIQNPGGVALRGRIAPLDQALVLQPGQTEASVGLPATQPGAAPRPTLRLIEDNGVVAELKAPRFTPLALESLRAALDGDAKIPAEASVVLTNAPAGPDSPAARVFRLDYQFAKGWRFVRCVSQGTTSVKLDADAAELGLWVKGDNSANLLRLRVTDEAGQTFQPNGPAVNWTGWRWVAFDLKDLRQAGHWGGPNDGRVHGGLRLDCALLVDGSNHQTAGSLYFTQPVLVRP